jgi:hypothetical protein
MPQVPLEKNSRSSDRLTRTIFFLSAVLFHVILFLAVAGWIVFRAPPAQPNQSDFLRIPTPVATTTPVVLPPVAPVGPKTPEAPAAVVTPTPASTDITIKLPGTGAPTITGVVLPPENPTLVPTNDLDKRLPKIERMNELRGRTPEQIANHDPSCSYPVYVAAYANGDWACNTKLDKDGNIVAGSIPDLVEKISEWSHGMVKGTVIPQPLNIASPELLDKMPPFIFFTGHKDFVLTDAEVDNLRQYLNDGGAIWGDNALAGEGSRFDVAFRREMKRVIPDRDKNFVPYSVSDNIFTQQRFPLSEFPSGMNYYAEPPQHLDIDGVLAILYTPNDYSDMMFMRINPGDTSFFLTYKPVPDGTLFTNTAFVQKQTTFYRNFDLKNSLAVHHLGMDIVTYMITRFDDKLLLGH